MAIDTLRYDRRTRVLHWVTALAVVALWCGAHAIDWFPAGPQRVDARSTHITVGVLLIGLIVYRVIWRRTGGVAIAHDASPTDRLAAIMHLALYALIALTLALGLTNAWVRGDSLFGLTKIPPLGSFDAAHRHAFSQQIVGWHELGANLILVLAAAHAVTALVHHFVLRDSVMGRMLG